MQFFHINGIFILGKTYKDGIISHMNLVSPQSHMPMYTTSGFFDGKWNMMLSFDKYCAKSHYMVYCIHDVHECPCISRDFVLCNHPICDYMWQSIICDYVFHRFKIYFIIITTNNHYFYFIIIIATMMQILNCTSFHID